MEPMSAFVILAFVALGFLAPFYGLCGIVAWNLLGDKSTAYLSVKVFGVPLFVTEATMAAVILSVVIGLVRRRAWSGIAGTFSGAWRALYANAAVSGLRGLAVYNPVRVVRDTALIYYSAFYHLTSHLVQSRRQLQVMAQILFWTVALKVALSLFSTLTHFPWNMFQPAAISIYCSCFIVAVCMMFPLIKGNWKIVPVAFVIIAFAEVIRWRVRSSWLGLIVFFVLFTASFRFFGIRWRHYATGVGLLALGFLFYLIGPSLAGVVPDWPKPVPVEVPAPESEPALPASPDLILNSLHSQPPVPVESVAPLQEASAELSSMFMGIESPNVSTRFCLWIDAAEEVVGVPFPFFSKFRRDLYNMHSDVRRLLASKTGPVILDKEIKGEIASVLANNRILRILNGVPFGKNFIPSRMFWRMWETNRYDPHNSHVAVFYRTGFIGFALYLFIVTAVFCRGVFFAYRTENEEGKLAMLSVLACFLVYFFHGMTDVVLENSYKGIMFWVLLGLIESVRRIYGAELLSPTEAGVSAAEK